ncbi:hypothetical protein [Rhodopirellula bahusiensis]|uniref:hypothetical protein n=1 Tax=Rhodopirellula bahusiensis TaxID=2014065 RepID=UPI0032648620
MNEQNPYQTTIEIAEDSYATGGMRYGGIGRLAFALGYFGITAVQWILAEVAYSVSNAGMVSVEIPLALIAGVATIALSWYRMINQGSSGFWAFATIIPLINLFVFLRCMVCPEGYADTKTLDTAGKVIGLVLFAMVLGIVGLIVTFAFSV